jgi:hypothetical protein
LGTLYFDIQARLPCAEHSARFFRAVYSRKTRQAPAELLGQLKDLGVETDSFLGPESLWEIEDCGVDEREIFHLKGMDAISSGYDLVSALVKAASLAGASSVLALLDDTATGTQQALSIDQGQVIELYATERLVFGDDEDDDVADDGEGDDVGDDGDEVDYVVDDGDREDEYFREIRRILMRVHHCTARLVQDGILTPEDAR